MIAAVFVLVIGQGAQPPPATNFCVDITKPARTSTAGRVLTMPEKSLYQLAERGAAVARGWKVEHDKCERNLSIETRRADEAELRLIESPPLPPEQSRTTTPPWLEVAGAGIGGVVGAYYGARARDEIGAAIGGGVGAIAGAAVGMMMRAIADEF